jgi:hypothetical protein
MKKVIVKIMFVVLICTIYVSANAQQVVATPAKPAVKTFIVAAETAKNLPEGVAYIDNKVTIKPGYKFEQLPNGGIRVVEEQNARNVISGIYACICNKTNGGSCNVQIIGKTLECGGDACCTLGVTVSDPPKKIAIKKSNAIKTNGQTETKQ